MRLTSIPILILILLGPLAATGDDSGLDVLDALIQSLSDRPNQFHLDVTATGMSVSQSGAGGIGVNIEVQGGGTGPTTGLAITMDTASINVAEQTATEALVQQAQQAVSILRAIRSELAKPEPKPTSLMDQLRDLGKTYVAPAIKAVVEAIVKSKLGKRLP